MKYVNISPILEEKLRKSFLSDHSKFVHASWLLKEDLGKTSVINGVTWTVAGLWDLVGIRRMILLKSESGAYAFEDSKIVSEGMGFYNMRNQVTGEEHKGWVFSGGRETASVAPAETEEKIVETSGVWTRFDQESVGEDEQVEEDEENVDPLVRALQQDLTDEDVF